MDENGVAIFLGLLCGDSLRYQARFFKVQPYDSRRNN